VFIFLRDHKNFAITDFVFSNIKKMDTGFRNSYNTTNTFIHFRYKVIGNWFAVTVFQIVCICITCFLLSTTLVENEKLWSECAWQMGRIWKEVVVVYICMEEVKK
jgi:hypothetical protein